MDKRTLLKTLEKYRQDIIRYRRIEKRLRESRVKYKHLVKHAPAAIYEVDLKRLKFKVANDFLCKYLGYTRQELFSMTLLDLLTEESKQYMMEKQRRLFADEKMPTEDIYALKRKDGQEVWGLVNSKFFYKKGRPVKALVVAFDITEYRRLEQAKIEFISMASHQLRTPLSAIRWTIELLAEDEHLTPKQKDQLRDIYMANLRLIDLVHDLLDISRIEAGQKIANKKLVHVGALIKTCLKVLRVSARKKRQRINVVFKTEIKKSNLDPMFFCEALNNILSNAIDYGLADSNIDVVVTSDDKDYIIAIHNNGLVIPESDYDKIFTKFYRGTEARHIHARGTGLGLVLAKSFIELNGGKIWFESKVDAGTTFYFTVPQ